MLCVTLDASPNYQQFRRWNLKNTLNRKKRGSLPSTKISRSNQSETKYILFTRFHLGRLGTCSRMFQTKTSAREIKVHWIIMLSLIRRVSSKVVCIRNQTGLMFQQTLKWKIEVSRTNRKGKQIQILQTSFWLLGSELLRSSTKPHAKLFSDRFLSRVFNGSFSRLFYATQLKRLNIP